MIKIDTTISLSQLPEDIRDIIENQFGVSDKELIILGALTTHRLETQFQNELLVLDQSEYL